ERTLNRRMVEVGLHDVRVGEVTRVLERGVDGIAQVHGDDVLRTELDGDGGVAAFAATAFEHAFTAKEVRLHRSNPVEELLLVVRGELVVMRPLVTERLRRALFDLPDVAGE